MVSAGFHPRFAQPFLSVFLTSPQLGFRIAKSALAQSATFDVLPPSDPFILLQSGVTGHWPEASAPTGAAIVPAASALTGTRA